MLRPRFAFVLFGVLAVVVCGVLAGVTAGAQIKYPNSIVVIGHSGATGYNSDPHSPGVDARGNSWATGSNPAVNSVYRRILARNPGIKGHNYNLAVDGSEVTDLQRQAREAVSLPTTPELVLVQTVDNDMHCDGTDPQNYKPYAAGLARTLAIIAKGAPDAHVFIVSIWATVRNYTNVIKNIPAERADNTGNGPCDVFDQTGKERPAGIASMEKIIDSYHKQIAVTCARFPNCRYDHGALYHMVIQRADLTPDSNHLSIRGQKKMAATAWSALYGT
jgi:lysophospholipase L1-like esterase